MRNCVQWSEVYDKSNPLDADTFATGFCMLPISATGYRCQVYANYYNNSWSGKNTISEAVRQKRHANFMLDTNPDRIQALNGFNYGIDFSPTVNNIGFGYDAFIVCIKYR